MKTAAATQRNMFVSFRGGAYSRAGTAFVGFSKQTGRQYPPRLIDFQFSVTQGIALEFGNFYMRPIVSGGFVLENPFAITGISLTDPAVVNYAALSTAMSAVPVNSGITASYARGDTVTIAGGVFTVAAVLQVQNTTLASLAINAAGLNYALGDQVTLTNNGTFAPPAVLTVTGINGSGGITSFAISEGGVFTLNGSPNFTQASTTGIGSGATFKSALWGPNVLSIFNPGSYSSVPNNPALQSATSGAGVGGEFTISWATPAALANGDWVFIQGVVGTTQVNQQTYVIGNLTPTQFSLLDVYGNPINAAAFTAYISGGSAARLYTLATIYSEQDLIYLKVTQSADVISVCCVNQLTGTEYPPQDLTRITDSDWAFSAVIPTQTISPPTSAAGTASTSGSVDYAYVVTAVNPVDGTESIASNIAAVASAVDIANTAGTITITWTPNPSSNEYNVYKAEPGYTAAPPVGSLFGFAGSAYGGSFLDSNIVADFTQVPPTHQNPFARGQILGATVTVAGSGASFTYTINSLTGSGAVLTPIVVANALVGFVVVDPGENYLPTDTITLDNGATATLNVGAESGTYPGVPAYFQERRAYGYSLNNPDTYWMSQPGSFTNLDFRIPTIDSDAITGSPWAVEVNGIQWMLLMPAGLLVMTGLSAWLLVGAGSFATNVSPISPASQDANPQAFTGCSPTVPPIKINYDVLYVTWEGSFYYDLPYQLYALSEPIDITQNSRHLFTGYSVLQHAWCEQPFKLLWAVRSDGILLSLTYFKAEQVAGWAHHDTNGTWQTVCAVKEPPNDALYLGAQRSFGTNQAYTIERMDNRVWNATEDCWCVDCGLELTQPTPNATLTASSATGLGSITGATALVAGQSYSAATTWAVVDNNGTGPGTGAVPTVVLNGAGGVASVTFSGGNQGSKYINPQLVPSDPTNQGSGFSCRLTLNNAATFTASAAVFSNTSVGSVIRMGGGIASITGFTSPTAVTANILSPIVNVIQGPAGPIPQVAASGNWTLTAPVATVFAPQFAGAVVTGLADGNVIAPQTVPANGAIALPAPATAVIIGQGFVAQLQSVYLDTGEPTVQGQRKKIPAVTVRQEASLGVMVTSNQQDGSTLSPPQTAVQWNTLVSVPTPPLAPSATPPPYNALCPSLYTGDSQRIPVQGGWQKPGQIALQQSLPYPFQCLSIEPQVLGGDKPEQAISPRGRQGGNGG